MAWNLDTDRPIYAQLVERIQMQIVSGYYAGRKASECQGTGSGGGSESKYHAKGICRAGAQRADYYPADQRADGDRGYGAD